jgi:hypothetical protein
MTPAEHSPRTAAGLNVGSGPHYAPGWWNIDVKPAQGHQAPDEVIDISELPRGPHYRRFPRAYLGHVLEHLPWDHIPDLLGRVAGCVRHGGQLAIVGPCIQRAYELRQPWSLIDAILADPRGAGDPWHHKWTPTEVLTLDAVTACPALTDVRAVPVATIDRPDWPNPSTVAWQCAILATVR